jgi:putative zinc finger/helix-turn-helix YgiT family protein
MCGRDSLRAIAHRRTVVADDGTELSYRDEIMGCSACGETHYTHEQALTSSRARAGALRGHAGLLSPDEIRAFRESRGLTQRQLEELLGTGPKTVVRWEKGTVCQSRAADRLLRLLVAQPKNIDLLRNLAEV